MELAARADTERRYVILVDYRSNGTAIAVDMIVTVVHHRWQVNLAYAMELVKRKQCGRSRDNSP